MVYINKQCAIYFWCFRIYIKALVIFWAAHLSVPMCACVDLPQRFLYSLKFWIKLSSTGDIWYSPLKITSRMMAALFSPKSIPHTKFAFDRTVGRVSLLSLQPSYNYDKVQVNRVAF